MCPRTKQTDKQWRQGKQRLGQNIGNNYIGFNLRQFTGQGGRQAGLSDAIKLRIISAGRQCLWVDIDGVRMFGTEQQGGYGKYARAATVIDDILINERIVG